MSLTKLCKPSETALRQLFNRQLFWICVLSSNGKMAPKSAVSHEIGSRLIAGSTYDVRIATFTVGLSTCTVMSFTTKLRGNQIQAKQLDIRI